MTRWQTPATPRARAWPAVCSLQWSRAGETRVFPRFSQCPPTLAACNREPRGPHPGPQQGGVSNIPTRLDSSDAPSLPLPLGP